MTVGTWNLDKVNHRIVRWGEGGKEGGGGRKGGGGEGRGGGRGGEEGGRKGGGGEGGEGGKGGGEGRKEGGRERGSEACCSLAPLSFPLFCFWQYANYTVWRPGNKGRLAHHYSLSLLLGIGGTWAIVFVIPQPSNLFIYENSAKKDITAFLFCLLLMAEGVLRMN